jgi:contactin 2
MKITKIFFIDNRAPEVQVEPRNIDQDEFTSAELRCTASGSPQPRIEWRRLDGRLSNDVVSRDGYLRFNSLRKSDQGSYQCSAYNDAGEDYVVIPIFVREQIVRPQPPPRPQPPRQREEVSINPSSFSGAPGSEVRLVCSSNPAGYATWTKAGSVELPENVQTYEGELTIDYASVDNSGRYVCTVRFPSGVERQSSADINIMPRSNEYAFC